LLKLTIMHEVNVPTPLARADELVFEPKLPTQRDPRRFGAKKRIGTPIEQETVALDGDDVSTQPLF
jgi:hypothetical protein